MYPLIRLIGAGLSLGLTLTTHAQVVLVNDFETGTEGNTTGFGYTYVQAPSTVANTASRAAGVGVGGGYGQRNEMKVTIPIAATPPAINFSGFGIGGNVLFTPGQINGTLFSGVGVSLNLRVDGLRSAPAPTGAFGVTVQFQGPDGTYPGLATDSKMDVLASFVLPANLDLGTLTDGTFATVSSSLGTMNQVTWDPDGSGGPLAAVASMPSLLDQANQAVFIIEFNKASIFRDAFLPSPLPDTSVNPYVATYYATIDNLTLSNMGAIPEPSWAGISAGVLALLLVASRRRR